MLPDTNPAAFCSLFLGAGNCTQQLQFFVMKMTNLDDELHSSQCLPDNDQLQTGPTARANRVHLGAPVGMALEKSFCCETRVQTSTVGCRLPGTEHPNQVRSEAKLVEEARVKASPFTFSSSESLGRSSGEMATFHFKVKKKSWEKLG